MRPKITVILTAYREPENIQQLLEFFLQNSLGDTIEVIASVDEPSEKLKEILSMYREKIVLSVSDVRRGKVAALNDALSLARGEVLIFLDSDVTIRDSAFLDALLKEIEEYDVMEIKKISKNKGLIGKLIYYDYLSFGIASYIFDRRVKRCAGLNGAAFAFRRNALKELGGFKNCLLEDMDIGFRSFYLNLRYRYFYSSYVVVDPPSSVREWINQRLRWSQGAWLWLKEYFPLLYKGSLSYPLESLSALVVMFPWIFIFMAEILLFFPAISGFLVTLWHLGLGFFAPLLPIVYLADAVLAFLPPQIYFTIPYFLAYSTIVYAFGRRIGYEVKPLWLTLYFFFYSPIWSSIMMASFLRTFILKKVDTRDWKI
ncbi:MAG: glycosyltransferase [Infirmifilum sp.]